MHLYYIKGKSAREREKERKREKERVEVSGMSRWVDDLLSVTLPMLIAWFPPAWRVLCFLCLLPSFVLFINPYVTVRTHGLLSPTQSRTTRCVSHPFLFCSVLFCFASYAYALYLNMDGYVRSLENVQCSTEWQVLLSLSLPRMSMRTVLDIVDICMYYKQLQSIQFYSTRTFSFARVRACSNSHILWWQSLMTNTRIHSGEGDRITRTLER